MHSLKAFLIERLTAAAEEIFDAVERTVTEYKEEISRSKDLEISRLRVQLKLLKSEPELRSEINRGGQQKQQNHHHHDHHHHDHPPPPPPPSRQELPDQPFPNGEAPDSQPSEEDGSSSMGRDPPQPSQVKNEQHDAHFWVDHDEEEQLESLESDIKDFISSPSSLRGNLQDPTLSFYSNHNDKPYCCSVCEKRFSNCSHLAAHIRTHTGERPYRCEICRKTFITTSALNRHQTIHTEGKQFICNYCGKCFKWMESLGRHVRSVHKRDNAPLCLNEPN